jgi:polar amino acid transport system substrate-binding protein
MMSKRRLAQEVKVRIMFGKRLFGFALAFCAASFAASASLHAATGDRPLAGKTFIVGIANGPPWSYRDQDGHIKGYSPDVVRAALEPLGAKLDFVIADFSGLIPALIASRFDIVAAGVAITPARCKQVAFSEPDLAVGDGLLVPKGNPRNLHSYADFAKSPDLHLGGARGSENPKNALAAGVPQDQMVYFASSDAMISALLSGRVDATTVSAPIAARIAASENLKGGIERALPFEGVKHSDGKPAQMFTATVFRQDEGELKELLNAQLGKLKQDGSLLQIMEQYGFSSAELPPSNATAQLCSNAN